MSLKIASILILGLTIFCSNSKGTSNKIQNTTELLVQNSPWEFDSYKLIKIVDKGNANVNESLLKYWVYNNSATIKTTFYNNGTGKYNDTEKDQEVTFKWTPTENEIEIKLDIPNSGNLYYKNVEVSDTQFKFEKKDLGFDKEGNKVTFYGAYFYK